MRFEVTDADTAAALGSGDLPVLGTPRLLAWMEAATVQAAASLLAPGQSTVGTAVRIRHRRPTQVNEAVEVHCQLGDRDRHRLTFHLDVTNQSEELIATGEIDRVIIDREQFLTGSP